MYRVPFLLAVCNKLILCMGLSVMPLPIIITHSEYHYYLVQWEYFTMIMSYKAKKNK